MLHCDTAPGGNELFLVVIEGGGEVGKHFHSPEYESHEDQNPWLGELFKPENQRDGEAIIHDEDRAEEIKGQAHLAMRMHDTTWQLFSSDLPG